jgi:hypothetical protein
VIDAEFRMKYYGPAIAIERGLDIKTGPESD